MYFGGHDFQKGLPDSNMRQAAGAQDDWITSAAAARAKGINDAIAQIKQSYGPYSQFGAAAIKRLTDLYTDPSSIRSTPGYGFRFDEGQRALEGSAAAKGGLFSGRAGKSLSEYGQNFGDTFYGNELTRGMQAAQQGNQWDMGAADRLANLNVALGNSNSQKYGDLSNYAFWQEQQGMDEAKQWTGFLRGFLGGQMGGGGGGGGGGNGGGGSSKPSYSMNNNQYQYSYGNQANGANNYGVGQDSYYMNNGNPSYDNSNSMNRRLSSYSGY